VKDPDFDLYVWLKNYNVLPHAGGLSSQPIRFIKVVEWCDMVSSAWHAWQSRNEDMKRRMMEKRRNNGK